MNILKIKNKKTNRWSKIIYPTQQQLEKARTILTRLQGFKALVPCDIESGKTEKLFNFKNWEVVN